MAHSGPGVVRRVRGEVQQGSKPNQNVCIQPPHSPVVHACRRFLVPVEQKCAMFVLTEGGKRFSPVWCTNAPERLLVLRYENRGKNALSLTPTQLHPPNDISLPHRRAGADRKSAKRKPSLDIIFQYSRPFNIQGPASDLGRPRSCGLSKNSGQSELIWCLVPYRSQTTGNDPLQNV